MALSAALLLLTLATASAGDDAAGRAVSVQAFTPPPVELLTDETEVRTELDAQVSLRAVSTLTFAATAAVEVEACALTASFTLSGNAMIECERPRPDPRRLLGAFSPCPCLPPTELRWQAAPRRRWRQVVPPSSLPLFWLHERPPLTWPAPRSERVPQVAYHSCLVPEPPRLCGGCCINIQDLGPEGWWGRVVIVGEPAFVGSETRVVILGDLALNGSGACGAAIDSGGDAAATSSSSVSATTSG